MSGRPATLPIVLTGTIIPNGSGGAQADPAQRRQEYLQAIQFYRQFAPVYFLENSSYALADDPDFAEAEDFHVRKHPLSAHPERGKGYQEFEMLDAWLAQETEPPARWMKITGRYLVRNIAAILKECSADPTTALVIDQIGRSIKALTYVFAVDTAYYERRIRGLYLQSDDRTRRYIEHVLGEALRNDPQQPFRFFRTQPNIFAVTGSSGRNLEAGRWRDLVKRSLRATNRLFDSRRLWYNR